MREIKFRAWDKEANIMVYSDHRTRKLYDVYYGFEMNGEGELECQWEGEFTESHVLDGGMLDNLMQYTGLKDKNGFEIYEGDIVEFTPFETSVNNCVVKFERGTFKMELIRSGSARMLCNYREDEIEIIGNIYQNKDLI